MRYNFTEFANIKCENIMAAIGKTLIYSKNGQVFSGIIKGAILTEIQFIPINRGKIDDLIGIELHNGQRLKFIDSSIEYIEIC